MICTSSSEFWLLFSSYIHRVSAANEPSLLEESVLPLLSRLNFLSECQHLAALQSILHSLRTAGFQLPLDTRKSLSTQLVHRALTSKSSCKARELIEYAKKTVDCSFYALREAIDNAKSMTEVDEKGNPDVETMLCVVEEEVCWYICDEAHLLQFVLEEAEDGRGPESSRLAGFLRRGLQSQKSEARFQALKLAVACSFHSRLTFSRLLPIFEASLYLEDFNFREYVLSALMDLIYMHHRSLKFNGVVHLTLSFLHAPTGRLQLAAVIGCGRLLLFDCFPDETERLLSAMLERYICNPSKPNTRTGNLEPVVQAMHFFFQEYSGGKKLHQDEIANTLVYMCLEKIEEGLLLIGDQAHPIQDNPEREDEAKRLHLALRFGLSITDNILDAVVDSLVLNINGEMEFPVLSKNACLKWLLASS